MNRKPRRWHLPRKTVIAWDFDGVLNRNIKNGEFLWHRNFETDLGQSVSVFTQHMFGTRLDDIITGKEDLRDRAESWSDSVGFSPGADALLAYWFEKDSFPDPAMLAIMQDLTGRGFRQVIATNQEARRTAFIENEMGFAALVERVFASGRMGVRKPESAFYNAVTSSLGVDAQDMLLIDDTLANVEHAGRCGWRAIHFQEKDAGNFRRRLFSLLALE